MLVVFQRLHLWLGNTTSWACVVTILKPSLNTAATEDTILALRAVLRVIREKCEILAYAALR
jgi:hypothetical protein